MPSYSSRQLYQDWRYAVDNDFVTADGKPFPYARHGKLQWGDETRKLWLDENPHDGSISSDGGRLAVAAQQNIYIIDTKTWETVTILKGHTSTISSLAFKPNDNNTLVSSEDDHNGSDPDTKPTIIVWKIDKAKETPILGDSALSGVGSAAAGTAIDKLAGLGMQLKEDEQEELKTAFMPALTRVMAKQNVANNIRIHGHLQTGFQSEIFSPSGSQMVYLPGDRPYSNGNVPWDMTICSTDNFKPLVTLKGHTDAIMWTGWSPNEAIFASVAWDGTIRIWDPASGQQLHCFETSHQNWTGAFSPDSKCFVATDGSGTIRVYSLHSEETLHWEFKPAGHKHWRRAVAWHPAGKLVAVGGETCGEILLLDVVTKEVVQKRTLSTAAAQVDDEELRTVLEGFVGVSEVKFVDRGNKLAAWTYGDSSIEVFDLCQQVKWRFARGGTEDGPNADKWRGEEGRVTSFGGHGMLAWERQGDRQ
ncbi:hypothetical protein ACJ41O_006556 [Fusarium nematophilum]